MRKALIALSVSIVLSACAGFTDRLPHYLAIADSALTESAQVDEVEEPVVVKEE